MSLPLATHQLLKDCVPAVELGSIEPGTLLNYGNSDVGGLLILGKLMFLANMDDSRRLFCFAFVLL